MSAAMTALGHNDSPVTAPGRFDVQVHRCPHGCRRDVDTLVPHYVGRDADPKTISAILPLPAFGSIDQYERVVLRKHKGVWSDITRAQRHGYTVRPFPWRRHLTDVVAINGSLPARQGRAMGPSYCRTVDEMGGEDPAAERAPIVCAAHWRQIFGVFAPDGHLVAYCSLIRSDNLAIYGMWLGHADHFAAGIMHLLHYELMTHLLAGDARTSGIDGLLYAGWNDGQAGLQAWKARLGFGPVHMYEAGVDAGPPEGDSRG